MPDQSVQTTNSTQPNKLSMVPDVSDFPEVTLVLPIRNEAAFIEENLQRLLNQGYPSEKIEIIVADGMSDDGTRDIVHRIVASDPRVTMIDNPERIVPTGLNAAIRAAKADIVIRVDGHTLMADDFVAESVKALKHQPEAWAVGGPIIQKAITPTGKAVAAAMSHKLGVGNATRADPDLEGYCEGTAFPAMYKWVFDKIGYYDENLVRNQDDEFYFRLNKAGGKFYVTPKIKYEYFVREKLSQLWRQYYQYSFWRIPVIRKHRQPTTLRQVVPSLFYLVMVIAAIVGACMGNLWVALALPAIYAAALIAVGFTLVPSLGWNVAMRVPAAIATLQSGYAWGMIHGGLCLAMGKQAWKRNNATAVALSR